MPIDRIMLPMVLSILLSGCATGASQGGVPINYNDVSWVVTPIETSFDGQERSRGLDELLFEQPLAPAAVAIFEERTEIAVPPATVFSGSPGTVVYEAGTQFSQLGGVLPEHAAYCDLNVSWKSPSALDGRKLRFCLVDVERDQIFDYLMWMVIPKNSNFSMPLTLSIPDNTISVPYTVQTNNTFSLMSLGVAFTKGFLGAYRVEYAVSTERSPIILKNENGLRASELRATKGRELDAETIFFRPEDLPLTIAIRGARIRVESVADDIFVYRLLSNFDPVPDLSVAYSGVLPRNN